MAVTVAPAAEGEADNVPLGWRALASPKGAGASRVVSRASARIDCHSDFVARRRGTRADAVAPSRATAISWPGAAVVVSGRLRLA